MQAYLPACKIVTTHGVRGEMKALPLCDGAAFLKKIKTLYGSAEGQPAYTLVQVREQGNTLLLVLSEIADMDAARAMVGKTLYFARADAKLPKGSFYVADILGCTVQDADTGTVYGIVTDVDQGGAQDLYTVTDAAGAPHLLPVVPAFIKSTDITERLIFVTPIPGLFEEAVNGDAEGDPAVGDNGSEKE